MKHEWKQWEGRTLNDRFPLRQFLGSSAHGAIFLTERDGGKAAIKLIAADPAQADQKLAQWKRAAALSHPHLIQLFEAGRAQIEGADVLFLVMEYAEEDLAQILPQRALTPVEARDMLGPVVNVLGYLHSKGLVHGHLKPTNILASGDQVKVSSDEIGQIGERFAASGEGDIYDPPEKARGRKSAAADVWSLGMTLTEALTRQLPRSNGKEHGELKLPEGLSSPFLDIARNCLWRDPEQRWSVNEIASRLNSGAAKPPQKPSVSPLTSPSTPPAERPHTVTQEESTRPFPWLWVAIALVVAAILAGMLVTRHSSENQPVPQSERQPAVPPAESKPSPAAPIAQPQGEAVAPVEKTPAPVSKQAAASGDEIAERVVPSIPKSARDTITGRVKVRIRIDVDPAGKVVSTRFELHGPSQYFARQALQAAERWKFAPVQDPRRQWDLLFEFGRSGTQVIPSRITKRR
jgi:TonB family protein